jgi:hypothetical protein
MINGRCPQGSCPNRPGGRRASGHRALAGAPRSGRNAAPVVPATPPVPATSAARIPTGIRRGRG